MVDNIKAATSAIKNMICYSEQAKYDWISDCRFVWIFRIPSMIIFRALKMHLFISANLSTIWSQKIPVQILRKELFAQKNAAAADDVFFLLLSEQIHRIAWRAKQTEYLFAFGVVHRKWMSHSMVTILKYTNTWGWRTDCCMYTRFCLDRQSSPKRHGSILGCCCAATR